MESLISKNEKATLAHLVNVYGIATVLESLGEISMDRANELKDTSASWSEDWRLTSIKIDEMAHSPLAHSW